MARWNPFRYYLGIFKIAAKVGLLFLRAKKIGKNRAQGAGCPDRRTTVAGASTRPVCRGKGDTKKGRGMEMAGGVK